MNIIHSLLTGCALSTCIHAQTTFIDSSFDGVANDTNGTFEILSNTQANGSGASWDQVTGFVNRGTTNASTAGAVSTRNKKTIQVQNTIIDGDIDKVSFTVDAEYFMPYMMLSDFTGSGGEYINYSLVGPNTNITGAQ